MVKTIVHKGLKELFEKGNSRRLPQERIKKLRQMLAVLHSATAVRDFNLPGARLHQLKEPPLRGYWSLDVTGNYRLVFRFENGDVYDLDFIDTH
ncbi:MAG: type II toxin-antitoxin system RelE/ParE family toxin [Cyclobacteriaceae bacterium]|nr:type II toxin-antitoxin system RelE/ParE family toxin [Cyclobacteriaceae bacterium]